VNIVIEKALLLEENKFLIKKLRVLVPPIALYELFNALINMQVLELEREIDTLKQNQATYKQQEFSKLPNDIQDTIIQQGRQMAEQARLVQLQAQATEKQRLQSLHKTKNWSELTPNERKEVRRLLVNAPEFENRQDYLDFKRTFGVFVERGR